MACLHFWGSPLQVGSQHLARAFATAGAEVAYFSAPVTPLHLLKAGRDNLKERFAIYRAGGLVERIGRGRLTAYAPLALFAPDNRPLLDSRFALERWPDVTLPNVTAFARRLGFGAVDTLYLDNFYHSFWLERIAWRRSVYRMTDRNDGFPGYSPAMRVVEERLVRSVDLVVYPSRAMEDHVASMRPKRMLFLPNGVDIARFDGPRHPEPELYRSIKGPRAVYLGAVDRWFDAALAAAAAKALPDIAFVIAGPILTPLDELRGLANVRLVGALAPADAPAFLEHAQLGIIPFDARAYPTLLAPLRPLKLLEYLAAGLPVVSTAWEELRAMHSPAHVCEDETTFIDTVARIGRAQKPDPAPLRAYARQYDWSALFATLEQALAETP